MTIKKLLRVDTWDFIPPTVNWLTEIRNSQQPSLSDEIRAGINYSIILNSACYIEGALEAGIKGISDKKHSMYHKLEKNDLEVRKTLNIFTNNLHEDLDTRISRTTGAENYSNLFEIIVGTPLNSFEKVKPLWEGVRVLFHFRNMIAHGRRIEIDYTLSRMQGKKEVWLEEFSGGYSKVEEYLLKNLLISVKFGEQENAGLFFDDKIADHFWKLAQDTIMAITQSLTGVDYTAFTAALYPPES